MEWRRTRRGWGGDGRGEDRVETDDGANNVWSISVSNMESHVIILFLYTI